MTDRLTTHALANGLDDLLNLTERIDDLGNKLMDAAVGSPTRTTPYRERTISRDIDRARYSMVQAYGELAHIVEVFREWERGDKEEAR